MSGGIENVNDAPFFLSPLPFTLHPVRIVSRVFSGVRIVQRTKIHLSSQVYSTILLEIFSEWDFTFQNGGSPFHFFKLFLRVIFISISEMGFVNSPEYPPLPTPPAMDVKIILPTAK